MRIMSSTCKWTIDNLGVGGKHGDETFEEPLIGGVSFSILDEVNSSLIPY